MLTAGKSTAGWRGPSQSRSLSGPQLGCRRRASQISVATVVGDFVRTPPRRPAAIAEAVTPALIESVQPLVARFPTNAVPRTQLGHGVQGQPVIANEAFSLFHRCRLQPGHRSTSQSIPSVVGVTHVPGLMCYQCTGPYSRRLTRRHKPMNTTQRGETFEDTIYQATQST